MGHVADDPTEDEAAQVDQGKVERLHTSFQKSAPKDEAKHVSEQVNRIGMKEPICDKPPIFMAIERLRVHRSISKQHFRCKARTARLEQTKREDQDIDAEQQLRHSARNIKETLCVARHWRCHSIDYRCSANELTARSAWSMARCA